MSFFKFPSREILSNGKGKQIIGSQFVHKIKYKLILWLHVLNYAVDAQMNSMVLSFAFDEQITWIFKVM